MYNADTAEATVVSVTDADGKQDAINRFKMKAVELNFV